MHVLLYHHWVRDKEIFAHERLRVQLAANLIIAGATATRPGALIGQLLYEHLEFQLFPPLSGDLRPRLVLKVNVKHIKRSGGRSDPKEFAFREDDMLIYDPLIPVMAMALADDAFLNGFTEPQDIYDLIVPKNSDRLRILWKDEWRQRPVFRDIERTDNGVRIALNKALPYAKERRHLIRLGRSIGLAKDPEWYDLRRGSGKKLNDALTPEERNKIMGHRQGDSKVYVQYYMSSFNDVDCQSICFGSAPQHDLIQLAGRLLRHGDAPTALTGQQRAEVKRDPELASWREKRVRALQRLKQQGYRNRAEADGTDIAAEYDRYRKKAHSLSQRLKNRRLQRAIGEFHNSVHVEEIERQLNGIKPPDVIVPPTIQYDLSERAHLARLLSHAADFKNRDELKKVRTELISTIAQLCTRRESPCRDRAQRGRKASAPLLKSGPAIGFSMPGHKAAEHEKGPTQNPGSKTKRPKQSTFACCPFCRWADDNVGSYQRTKLWRIDSLARHLRLQHLRLRHMPFKCPYSDCSEVLYNTDQFPGHAARQHRLYLPPSVAAK